MDCSVHESSVIRNLQEHNPVCSGSVFTNLVFSTTSQSVNCQECVCTCMCSVLSDSVTPWTGAHQAFLYMETSRQEYWNGLPFPSPGDLPDPEIKPTAHLATKNNENPLLSLPLYTVTLYTEVQRNILSQLVGWAAAYYTKDTMKDLTLHKCKELWGHKMPKTNPLPFSLLRHRQFNAKQIVINALP